MFWWVWQLARPLAYLRIRQGDSLLKSKSVYDFVLPVVFGTITTFAYHLLPIRPDLLGEGGLLSQVVSLLQLLTAFFIAALAAVATFPGKSLDERLSGGDARLSVWNNEAQDWIDKILTRRQFISYLFGYLSLTSLLLFLCILFAQAIYPSLCVILPAIAAIGTEIVVGLFFWIAFWNVILTSLLGLYFLTERLQEDA